VYTIYAESHPCGCIAKLEIQGEVLEIRIDRLRGDCGATVEELPCLIGVIDDGIIGS